MHRKYQFRFRFFHKEVKAAIGIFALTWIHWYKGYIHRKPRKLSNLELIVSLLYPIRKVACTIPYPVIQIPRMIQRHAIAFHIKGHAGIGRTQGLDIQIIHLVLLACIHKSHLFTHFRVNSMFFQKVRTDFDIL